MFEEELLNGDIFYMHTLVPNYTYSLLTPKDYSTLLFASQLLACLAIPVNEIEDIKLVSLIFDSG